MNPTWIFALLALVKLTEAGVSYIRWGRTQCPEGNYKLYQGFMAGGHYNGGGAGSNHLCMPQQPQFVRGVAGIQGTATVPEGAIWGVEMQVHTGLTNLFLTDNIPSGQQLLNQDLPCVVCYVEGSTNMLMIPARHDCYGTGYDLQYKGFLVSEGNLQGRKRGEYICLDEAPEGIPGGTATNDQSVVYPVEIACGSLPCNPYVHGMEATCAVCTY